MNNKYTALVNMMQMRHLWGSPPPWNGPIPPPWNGPIPPPWNGPIPPHQETSNVPPHQETSDIPPQAMTEWRESIKGCSTTSQPQKHVQQQEQHVQQQEQHVQLAKQQRNVEDFLKLTPVQIVVIYQQPVEPPLLWLMPVKTN